MLGFTQSKVEDKDEEKVFCNFENVEEGKMLGFTQSNVEDKDEEKVFCNFENVEEGDEK